MAVKRNKACKRAKGSGETPRGTASWGKANVLYWRKGDRGFPAAGGAERQATCKTLKHMSRTHRYV